MRSPLYAVAPPPAQNISVHRLRGPSAAFTVAAAAARSVCKAASCDPAAGLTEPGLLLVYTALQLGDADADFAALGLAAGSGGGGGGGHLTVAQAALLKRRFARIAARHYRSALSRCSHAVPGRGLSLREQ